MRRLSVLALFALAACATQGPMGLLEDAERLRAAGRIDDALAASRAAVDGAPGDARARYAYQRSREQWLQQRLAQADNIRATGDTVASDAIYKRVLEVDPGNTRASAARAAIETERRQEQALADAEALLAKKDLRGADAAARAVLAENPAHRGARMLLRRIADAAPRADPEARRLKLAADELITLEFRDAPLKTVFDLVARTAKINIAFDRDVRPDLRTSIFVKDARLDDVVRILLATNQLDRRVLNDNSILVYPNTPAKQREYQELVVRSFYLANADVKQALAMVKALIKTRDVYIDERLNLLVMKDTPEAVRLAERLIAAQDLHEPEVMLEVEVLEVATSRLQELGLRFPERIGYGVFDANAALLPGVIPVDRDTRFRAGVVNPVVALNLRAQDGLTNLLANPRIRVKNRGKAKIHIGEKVPVFTSTITANVGTTSSVSYLDVGLKLDVEPNVFLEDEVAINVALEVSSILEQIAVQNTLAYRLGTRNTSTVLRLRDGETQVLAGLISDEDRRTANKIPGLGDLPMVGRIFSSNFDQRTKTDVVLLLTPRIIRNITRPDDAPHTIPSGTDVAPGAAPLAIGANATFAIQPLGGAANPARTDDPPTAVPVIPVGPPTLPVLSLPPVEKPPARDAR